MKHTYIFRLCDVESINDDLNRLVAVLRNSKVSYRAESEDRYYLSVQVFTDEKTMHHIAHRAGFSGEQLRVALPAARRNGDAAVAQAEARMRGLRKPPAPSLKRPDDTARLNWLEARDAGLNRPLSLGGLAHVWLADGGDCPTHHYDQTYRDVIDRAMGYKPSPQMGSTPATRRSKRSA